MGKFRSHSKIVKYGLQDITKDLFKQGLTYQQIANECNKVLSGRKSEDGKEEEEYREVTIGNLHTYITRLKDNMSDEEKGDLDKKFGGTPDVVNKLENLIRLVDEKVRIHSEDDEDVDSFVKLSNSLKECLRLLADIQGKLQQRISIDVFQTNVIKIVDVIKMDSELESRDKRRLLQKVVDAITLDNSGLDTADIDTVINKRMQGLN